VHDKHEWNEYSSRLRVCAMQEIVLLFVLGGEDIHNITMFLLLMGVALGFTIKTIITGKFWHL
jgi:hypothetical protein